MFSDRQLELPIERPSHPDRNYDLGGRSFYFFDFDDNVMFLPTTLYLFHAESGEEIAISTREFAAVSHMVGKDGPWRQYKIDFDPQTGSFRRFRHHHHRFHERLIFRKKQPLIEDLLKVIRNYPEEWRGPSWNFFWHAVHNGRPLSIITARGHRPETFMEGISILRKNRFLTREPNYLSIFPVSHFDTRKKLGDEEGQWHTATLKKAAIQKSVEDAFRIYGANPAHRFGMSDDDPQNIKLIIEAMQELKARYPRNSFFVIDTHNGRLAKQEIFSDHLDAPTPLQGEQLNLFND